MSPSPEAEDVNAALIEQQQDDVPIDGPPLNYFLKYFLSILGNTDEQGIGSLDESVKESLSADFENYMATLGHDDEISVTEASTKALEHMLALERNRKGLCTGLKERTLAKVTDLEEGEKRKMISTDDSTCVVIPHDAKCESATLTSHDGNLVDVKDKMDKGVPYSVSDLLPQDHPKSANGSSLVVVFSKDEDNERLWKAFENLGLKMEDMSLMFFKGISAISKVSSLIDSLKRVEDLLENCTAYADRYAKAISALSKTVKLMGKFPLGPLTFPMRALVKALKLVQKTSTKPSKVMKKLSEKCSHCLEKSNDMGEKVGKIEKLLFELCDIVDKMNLIFTIVSFLHDFRLIPDSLPFAAVDSLKESMEKMKEKFDNCLVQVHKCDEIQKSVKEFELKLNEMSETVEDSLGYIEPLTSKMQYALDAIPSSVQKALNYIDWCLDAIMSVLNPILEPLLAPLNSVLAKLDPFESFLAPLNGFAHNIEKELTETLGPAFDGLMNLVPTEVLQQIFQSILGCLDKCMLGGLKFAEIACHQSLKSATGKTLLKLKAKYDMLSRTSDLVLTHSILKSHKFDDELTSKMDSEKKRLFHRFLIGKDLSQVHPFSVIQGSNEICWVLSSVCSILSRNNTLLQHFMNEQKGSGKYVINAWNEMEFQKIYEVDNYLPTKRLVKKEEGDIGNHSSFMHSIVSQVKADYDPVVSPDISTSDYLSFSLVEKATAMALGGYDKLTSGYVPLANLMLLGKNASQQVIYERSKENSWNICLFKGHEQALSEMKTVDIKQTGETVSSIDLLTRSEDSSRIFVLILSQENTETGKHAVALDVSYFGLTSYFDPSQGCICSMPSNKLFEKVEFIIEVSQYAMSLKFQGENVDDSFIQSLKCGGLYDAVRTKAYSVMPKTADMVLGVAAYFKSDDKILDKEIFETRLKRHGILNPSKERYDAMEKELKSMVKDGLSLKHDKKYVFCVIKTAMMLIKLCAEGPAAIALEMADLAAHVAAGSYAASQRAHANNNAVKEKIDGTIPKKDCKKLIRAYGNFESVLKKLEKVQKWLKKSEVYDKVEELEYFLTSGNVLSEIGKTLIESAEFIVDQIPFFSTVKRVGTTICNDIEFNYKLKKKIHENWKRKKEEKRIEEKHPKQMLRRN